MNPHSKLPLVLEVNGSPEGRTLVASTLQGADLDVVRARDAATAIAIAREAMPDVVLLEVTSALDVYEVTRRLRAEETTAGIPIVHTADGSATARVKQDSFDAGADAHVGQPIAPGEIAAVVGSLARLRRAERTAAARAATLHAEKHEKDQLIATLAHKIRNPLSAIRTGFSLLEGLGADEQHAARVRAIIGRQIESLLRIVDDLIDAERVSPSSATPGAPREEEPAPSGTARRSRRVLLVDDHVDSRELFQAVLQGEGDEVTVVGDGEQALSLLVAGGFEVAVIDIGLPGLDGYEVARRTREHLGKGTPLLVAMTGYAGAHDRDAAARAGFDAHLVKPVDPGELVATIDKMRGTA